MKRTARVAVGWMCLLCAAPVLASGIPGMSAATPKIVHFELSGPLLERPAGEMITFSLEQPESLKDLVDRMKKAREDDAVKAVVITFESPMLGFAQLQELRQAIAEVRVGKDVYVHADELSTGLYALASAATHVSVVPAGTVWLMGMYGESPYLRGTLDKIGVVPEILHCGDYKSAGEILMRSGPSEPAQEMMNWLYDDLFESLVGMIAESRGKTPDEVKKLMDQGLFMAEDALKAGLLDSVQHRQALVNELKERYGADAKIVRKYGEDTGPQIDLSNPFAIFELFKELMGPAKKATKDAVAIVYVDGPIMPGSEEPSPFGAAREARSTTIRKALDKAANDRSVKAVVLRVDSPGGSAVASEIIYDATQRVKEKKPFVVSMGNVAGSGGYYVSCGSDTIYADETTITASIGVVGGKVITTGMWDKLGVSWHPMKRGGSADLLNTSRPFTEAEKEKVLSWMEDIYGVFKGHVTSHRGEKLAKPIDELAGGRVFTGKQALARGLVDKMGTLTDAVKFAATEAKISDYDVRVFPEPKNFFDLLMEAFGGEEEEDVSLSGGAGATLFGRQSPLLDALPILDQVDPNRAAVIWTALIRLQLIHEETVIMMMPFEIVLR